MEMALVMVHNMQWRAKLPILMQQNSFIFYKFKIN